MSQVPEPGRRGWRLAGANEIRLPADAKLIGATLTGRGWATYYATADGEVFLATRPTRPAFGPPAHRLGSYGSAPDATAAARRAIERDIRIAGSDMRVAFADVETLLAESTGGTDWTPEIVDESPVAPADLQRTLANLLSF